MKRREMVQVDARTMQMREGKGDSSPREVLQLYTLPEELQDPDAVG